MLTSLSIRDFVIIDSLDLQFESGLSALTGETGAGKSILLDALSLALGMRSDASLVRQGAKESVIIAEFILREAGVVNDLLTRQSIPHEESLIIRRLISSTGKGKAYVNDHQVSITFLRELGDVLLEIHGQFDRLLTVSSHRKLLDAYLVAPELIASVRAAYQDWQGGQKNFEEAAARLDHLRRHEDFLKYQLKELETLNPEAGEEAQLIEARQALSGFAKLFDIVHQAYQTLQSGATLESLQQSFRALQRLPETTDAHVDAATKSLKVAVSEVTEAVAQLDELYGKIDDQPAKLQQIDDRLQALRAAGRKHNVAVDDLATFLEQLREDLETLDQAEQRTTQLEKIVLAKKNVFYQVGKQLHEARVSKAKELDASMAEELPLLMLPNAKFHSVVGEVEESAWHEAGIDKVQFLVAMNKGQELSPLEKTASGGELARLMLSLKATLATTVTLPTIIFDEIDIGVGGAVAAAIGQRLAKLAQHVQVLAITHSPQVAAASDHHYLVLKQDVGEKMQTTVAKLPLTNRYDELARMLSGVEVTDEARAAAKKLLSRYG
ncbi:DNA repair protein RecN [Candidatus Paracaedibacter symbiosus]|uniref:DNA repair protein RecN n=1 Tax=Candidatus Paracaedibacter symbiosus TaxID=244582 RepID=UPI0005093F32|nr:DNA repair protein RecN [Candidatus Paracaedibacter symbiosus]